MAKSKTIKKRIQKSEIKKRKKQIDVLWLVLAVMIFIILISSITKKNDFADNSLKKEAEVILTKLTDDNYYSVAPNNIVEEERLEKVSEMAYSELKNNLNVENDFCIYFEDDNGNLVEIKKGIKGIGSDVIEINGEPCGK